MKRTNEMVIEIMGSMGYELKRSVGDELFFFNKDKNTIRYINPNAELKEIMEVITKVYKMSNSD